MAGACTPPTECHHVNTAQVEGVVVKIWQYNRDVYVRLACYDAHAEPLPVEEHETDPGAGQAGPRRQASYVSLWLKQGRTADSQPVSLQPKDKILVTGYLRERVFPESLARILEKMKRGERRQPGDDELTVGRAVTYLVVETLIRFTS